MSTQDLDIRWLQRFKSYQNALARLSDAVMLAEKQDLSDLEKEGVIQRFEFTHELAWKTIKDFFESIGENSIKGSLDAFRLAFNRGLISTPALIEAIESRNKTVHIYDEEIMNKVFDEIRYNYLAAFQALETSLLDEKQQRGL